MSNDKNRVRLDRRVVELGLAPTNSAANKLIRAGQVKLNKNVIKKYDYMTLPDDKVSLVSSGGYVSRAGKKLASISDQFELNFTDATVLDVGSSTGGFTHFALENGAKKIIAVDSGSNQLHPSLRTESRIELHEKTDILSLDASVIDGVDIILMDVSFTSVRPLLLHVKKQVKSAMYVIMVKPQFEAEKSQLHKGVVKNERTRRDILKNFEQWAKENNFVIHQKKDSEVDGVKGNTERFYKLT